MLKKSKRFVCVQLMGGLGNQMFQYATASALARRWKVPLYLNKRWHSQQGKGSHRPYALAPFQGQALRWEQDTGLSKRLFGYLQKAKGIDRRIFHIPIAVPLVKIFSRIFFGVTFYSASVYRQTSFDSLRPSVFLIDTYWQCEGYFKPVADSVRKDFDLRSLESARTKPLLKKIQQPNTVSLHVRKGDYNAISQLPLSYYEKAVQLIGHLVADPHFFVFSDEIDKAKEMLKSLLDKATYVSDPRYTMHEEMLLMSRCAHHIMANSSFSWWAAWLSAPPSDTPPDKHVFAPRLWYSDGELKHQPDIHCEGWILL